ncbi:MAG: hypothetical protein RLZZ387_4120 [Chloroflexota bacterium]
MPIGQAKFTRDAELQFWIDDAPVMALSHAGERIALTLTARMVLIAAADYWQLLKGEAPLNTH